MTSSGQLTEKYKRPFPNYQTSRANWSIPFLRQTAVPLTTGCGSDYRGRSSYFGWRWSGGGFMTAVVEIVCRPSIGRHGQAQGLPLQWRRGGWRRGRWRRGGWNTGRCLNRSNCPRRSGTRGGRCGGNPPAQGRAEGPTARNCSGQWSVISGQRRLRLPCSGQRIDASLVIHRGVREFPPILTVPGYSGR